GKLRTSLMIVLCAYTGFVMAGLALYVMVDDSPFVPLMNTHLELAAVWYLVAGGSAIGLLAVVVGGLPIGPALLVRAFTTRRKDLLLLLAVPVVALVVLGSFVAVVAAIATHFFTQSLNQVDVQPQVFQAAPLFSVLF